MGRELHLLNMPKCICCGCLVASDWYARFRVIGMPCTALLHISCIAYYIYMHTIHDNTAKPHKLHPIMSRAARYSHSTLLQLRIVHPKLTYMADGKCDIDLSHSPHCTPIYHFPRTNIDWRRPSQLILSAPYAESFPHFTLSRMNFTSSAFLDFRSSYFVTLQTHTFLLHWLDILLSNLVPLESRVSLIISMHFKPFGVLGVWIACGVRAIVRWFGDDFVGRWESKKICRKMGDQEDV